MTNEYDVSKTVMVGDVAFLFFPSDDGGRLVPAKEIKSIVPDFKNGGSMVFLTNTDKAIRTVQTPEEITDDIYEATEAG